MKHILLAAVAAFLPICANAHDERDDEHDYYRYHHGYYHQFGEHHRWHHHHGYWRQYYDYDRGEWLRIWIEPD